MFRNVFSRAIMMMLLVGIWLSAFDVLPARADGPIYIRADGSIEPSALPIQRSGNFYVLTGDVVSQGDGIVVERDDITLDGAGNSVEGAGSGRGIDLAGSSNVTIRNMKIRGFNEGVYLSNGSNHNSIVRNNMAESRFGICLYGSSNNTIFHNNFLNNEAQTGSDPSLNVWDNDYPSGGNYWSNDNPPDENKDKIGDVPHTIAYPNVAMDRYPLVYPFEYYLPSFTPEPDLNRDEVVNIVDIAMVAKAFGCRPGDSNWNPLTDMDLNEIINIVDVSKAAKEFGKEGFGQNRKPETLQKRTFTWIGHFIDESYAKWASDLGFTDVVMRASTGDDVETSVKNLAKYNITYWRYVGSWMFIIQDRPASEYTVEYFEEQLAVQRAWSPNGNMYIDDCQSFLSWIDQPGLMNFFEAVRQVQKNDTICDFYAPSEGVGNFVDEMVNSGIRDLDIDIYHVPTVNTADVIGLLMNGKPRSIGQYLWAWGRISQGTDWNHMTEALICKKYAEAKVYGMSRMCVWDGDSPDSVELGLYNASLYNFPRWWSLIREQNTQFLGKE